MERPMKRIRAYPLTLLALAVLASAMAAVALAAPSHVAPKDSFRGTISIARGAFVGDNGRVSMQIGAGQSTTGTRTATLEISGRRCHGAQACVRLTGTLTGRLTRMSTIPDVGESFALSASGRVRPLGHVSATGQVHGTGFIMRGHETLTLRLSNSRGEVDLQAQSPLVPGFTSP
jgi:hypothetical protein